MNWATRTKNKVHVITPLVKGVMEMEYCRNHRLVAKVLKCSPKSVERIRVQLKSSAHVFLAPETLRGMK